MGKGWHLTPEELPWCVGDNSCRAGSRHWGGGAMHAIRPMLAVPAQPRAPGRHTTHLLSRPLFLVSHQVPLDVIKLSQIPPRQVQGVLQVDDVLAGEGLVCVNTEKKEARAGWVGCVGGLVCTRFAQVAEGAGGGWERGLRRSSWARGRVRGSQAH